MSTNVVFYEKLKSVQEFQHNSETQRLELEKQLNHYMRSDHRLDRLKAVRLQNYWKKLCDDEKRSEWRNEQLLKDIERVEGQMASLSARTDRLKTMKRQYEEYIERVYPQWKEKVLAFQEFKKQQSQMDIEKYANASLALQQGSAMPGTQFPATSTPIKSAQQLQEQPFLGQPLQQPFMGQQSQQPFMGQPAQQPFMGQPAHQQPLQHLMQQQQQQLYQQHQQQGMPFYQQQQQQQQVPVPNIKLMGPSGIGTGSTMQTVSDLPTGYSLTSNIQQQGQQQNMPFGSMESTAFSTGDFGVPSGYEDRPSAPEPRRRSSDRSSRSASEKVTAVPVAQQQHYAETPRDDEDSWRSEDQTPRSPRDAQEEATPRTPRGGGGSAQQLYANVPPPPDDDFADTSEFASDVELPLSGQEDLNEKPQPTQRSARSDSVKSRDSVEHQAASRQSSGGSGSQGRGRLSRQQSVDPAVAPVVAYPQADVTLEGLYNLLSAVQDTFPGAFTPTEHYRDQLPPQSVRKDVISNANKGTTLAHIGGESISMVILDQLPLVCANCEEACLLPDSFLSNPPATLTPNLVRSKIHPASRTLWDKLCEHFTKVIKYNILQANEVATIFSPLLISSDSPYEDKAHEVLTSLLENLPSEDLQPSPNSTATLSLPLSPKGKPSFSYHDNQPETEVKQPEPPEVQPEPMGSVNLTQTAAYRQLLGDTVSTTQKSVSYEDSDDSSADSVEKALKAHSLATSPRSDAAPTPGRKPSEPMVVPTGGTEEKDVSEMSSVRETGGGGYLPSGLDTGKSTVSMGSTSRSGAKGPGFNFGDSDTDEDVDIPGTKTPAGNSLKHGQEDDDFDFYG